MSDRKAFLLRIDPAVHDALQRWANDELRSLNGQVEFLLRQALRSAGRLGAVRPEDAEPPAAGRATKPASGESRKRR